MKRNILLIGRGGQFFRVIEKLRLEDVYTIYAIEEGDVLRKMKAFESKVLGELKTQQYHGSDEFLQTVEEWSQTIEFHGVIPSFEYSVKAANKAAKLLSLPRIGDIGADIFTNKLNMRKACKAAGIPSPRYTKIDNVTGLYEFFEGKPIIFKPANRHASIGIGKITVREDIDRIYQDTTKAYEFTLVPDRELQWEYIAEEYIEGEEISVECLIKAGEIRFINFTNKNKFPGTFVESGHIVPADIFGKIKAQIEDYLKKLISVASVDTSILHSEWIISNNTPYFIECAARMAGDQISDLITNSYGFNFRKTYIDLMCNDIMNIEHKPKAVTGISFFRAADGTLKEVKNLELLGSEYKENIIEYSIDVKKGDKLKDAKSSWDRVGHFILETKDHKEISRISEDINSRVKFIVE